MEINSYQYLHDWDCKSPLWKPVILSFITLKLDGDRLEIKISDCTDENRFANWGWGPLVEKDGGFEPVFKFERSGDRTLVSSGPHTAKVFSEMCEFFSRNQEALQAAGEL